MPAPLGTRLRPLAPRPLPGVVGLALLALAALALHPGELRAQDASCEFLEGTQSFNMITLSGGGTITYLGRPRIGCPDGVRIVADSAVSYSAQDMTHLIGGVLFRDGTRELRAREARYFPGTGRLQASGDVRLEDAEDGSVVENGDLVLLRETDFRDRSELTVTLGPDGVRPRATLFLRPPPDTAQAEAVDTVAAPSADSAAAAVEDPVSPDSLATESPADTTGAPAADTVGTVQADSLAAAGADTVSAIGADTAVATGPDTLPDAEVDTLSSVEPDTAVAADSDAPAPLLLPDTAGAPADTTPPTPYQVVGNRLFFQGDRYFEATGDVEIDRDSLHATGQRAEYDEDVGYLLLENQARVDGSTYDLEGEEIRLDLAGGAVGQVTARRRALLVGQDLRLDAPVIHLFLRDELLDRLVAVPVRPGDDEPEPDSTLLARPVATAESFRIVADSLDVRAPGQELDRIWAVGRARGVSMARDSLNVESLPEVARNDWIEGDTILATFRRAGDPSTAEEEEAGQAAAGETTSPETLSPDTASTEAVAADPAAVDSAASDEYVLDQLIASGSARSLYRLLPSDTTARAGVDPPAVHYVVGSRITIALAGGEVESMEVEGPTEGFHLEPMRRGAPPADSLADTLAVPGAEPGPGAGAAVDTVAAPGSVERGAPRSPASPPPAAPAGDAHPILLRGRWSP